MKKLLTILLVSSFALSASSYDRSLDLTIVNNTGSDSGRPGCNVTLKTHKFKKISATRVESIAPGASGIIHFDMNSGGSGVIKYLVKCFRQQDEVVSMYFTDRGYRAYIDSGPDGGNLSFKGSTGRKVSSSYIKSHISKDSAEKIVIGIDR